jgi:hypothetical protein
MSSVQKSASGELLTRLGAREIIEELRRKVATHKS